MTLKPAEADTGIVFVRTDLQGRPEIKALPENVSSTVKATTLSANGAEVFTVEQLDVYKRQGLAVVVDKNTVVFGGVDITDEVAKSMQAGK